MAAGERNSGLSGAGWSGNLGSSRLTVYLILIQDRKMPTRLLISPAFIILPSLLIQSFGLEYIVGDSFWSIPTTNDFYTNWSSSHFFQTGDTLCKSNDLSLVQIEIRESIISILGYNTLILALIRGFFCFCFSFFWGYADFDFDSGLHNVMEMSRREYESCSADNPFKVLWDGPASVALMEEGVFYFVCSIANYCALGQKLSVPVHSEKNSPHSAPTSSQRPPIQYHFSYCIRIILFKFFITILVIFSGSEGRVCT